MQEPLQLAFRNMAAPIGLEEAIREEFTALEQFCDRIAACHVTVEAEQHRQRHGKLYRVRIVMTVPGREIVVAREPAERHRYDDVHIAMRDAFHAARRQLVEYARMAKGAVKTHVAAQPDMVA
ncbi:MAG: ribosome-associated translation inhibitor RaiA [Proteobacteria bacterium]|nr:ribosome-associated translation inhibitor RaiA [Pseudomonadota bacterium]